MYWLSIISLRGVVALPAVSAAGHAASPPPLNWFQALFLAFLQGVTELFPVSSLGHTVVIPTMLGWPNVQSNDTFLPFVVMLHVGTATALLTFFWRDWVRLIRGFIVTSVKGDLSASSDGRLCWLIVAGTIPAGLIGFLLEKPLQHLFASPIIAAAFIFLNGSVLFVAERLRRGADAAAAAVTMGSVARSNIASSLPGGGTQTLAISQAATVAETRPLETLTFKEAFLIGAAQSLALIPGISRSGIAMVAGMSVRLSHEAAARFAFLLATPLIAAAGLLEVPKLFTAGTNMLVIALVSGLVAGIAAYFSVRYLMKYFEFGRLDPFAYYCWAAGALSLVLLIFVFHA
jgi:undecaprenyl-diphosphatase